MNFYLTKEQADEIEHKLSILADEPELLAGHSVTEPEIRELIASLPLKGGAWEVPENLLDAVQGEMENAINIMRDQAATLVPKRVGMTNIDIDLPEKERKIQARKINRLANSLEKVLGIGESKIVANIIDNLIKEENEISPEELLVGDYVNTRQGEGYIVATSPNGYVISMKRRDTEGRRVSHSEINKVWDKKVKAWATVKYPDTQAEGYKDVLAAAAIGAASLFPSSADAKHVQHKHHVKIEQPAKYVPRMKTEKPDKIPLNSIVNAVVKHEGLQPGQTPFRITNPVMRKWNHILGFDVDKTKHPERQNFIYLKNPQDVPKAVTALFRRYAQNPAKYGFKGVPTLKDAIKKFDQTGASGKMLYLAKTIPGIDFDKSLDAYL